MSLRFGIYAGGLGADSDGTVTPGPPERSDRISATLAALHGDRPFLVRGYVHYTGAAGSPVEAPPAPWQYVTGNRRLDLVVCFRDPGDDLSGWTEYLRALLRQHGDHLEKIQVAEEPNHNSPGGDGGFPAVRRAVVEGVLAAKDEVGRLGLDVGVGCNSTPVLDPEQEFWTDLGRIGGREFVDALDYVGLDFFPDVFRPLPPAQFVDAVVAVLTGFREHSLAAAGIGSSTPVHVTENGWGTGTGRSYARQTEVLDTIVRTIDGHSVALNIAAYEHFALRDADSMRDEPIYQLGIVRSDYTPKPAFETYRELVAELTS